MRGIINWKTFFILLGACVVTSMLVLPYQAALVPAVSEMGGMLYLAAFAQGLIIFSIVTFFGLLLARKVGFEMPILEGDNRWGHFRSIVTPSVLWGIMSGVLIILTDFAFQGLSISLSQGEAYVPVWTALLASFYGGIAEEVLMRLFAVTLIVWLIAKVKKTKAGSQAAWSVWAAIILASVLFGLGHLPITSALTDITFTVIVRAIVLNGIGGVVFGWLYWKKGLVSAMVAHFTVDIVLHVILPVVARWL